MVALLREGEEVRINVFSAKLEEQIIRALEKEGIRVGDNVFLHRFPAYEPWVRDHGPIFVHKPGQVAVVDWRYNAWGGKYPPFDLDDEVPTRIAELLKLPLFKPDMILEGGSIDVNGEGTLLTTETCLLNPNRNPHMSKAEIEKMICDYLGMKKILWLGDGIIGDDTDGHVDDLTRFTDATTVVTIVEQDPQDANYEALTENLRRLRTMTTAKNQPLNIVELPMPGYQELYGRRVPATYANFYIANKVVLLPAFGHKNDAVARDILQKLFPTRRVVLLDCSEFIWGWGAFHCATQQQPSVNLAL
jgi:agmatine deiminase